MTLTSQSSTKRGLRSVAKAFFLLGLVTLTANCASFRGMGEYRQSNPRVKPMPREKSLPLQMGDETPSKLPSIVWNGERKSGRATNTPPVFEWPVSDIRMSRGFLYGARAHWGLDLANHRGTPILSAEEGTVIYTGTGFRGYGKLVVIEHNDEWATLYAHLDKITVKEGQVVAKGQRLGGMGRTGRSSGVHLHFEIRYRRQPVNPLAYLPDLPRLASRDH